jgi:hypothetical protein
MKLIEVVVLTGAHCISPVQHTGAATEVAKVECAVVIEKDTQSGTLRIVPAGASSKPEVVAVLKRLDGETRIEPAFAPPAAQVPSAQSPAAAPAPMKVTVPAPAPETPPQAVVTEAPPPAEPAEPAKTRTAEVEKPKAGPPKPKKAEAPKDKVAGKNKCVGEAKPKWYTNAEGRRKYRCVLPG